MKSKTIFCGVACAVVLQLGVLAGSARAHLYLYSGSEANVILNPGIPTTANGNKGNVSTKSESIQCDLFFVCQT